MRDETEKRPAGAGRIGRMPGGFRAERPANEGASTEKSGSARSALRGRGGFVTVVLKRTCGGRRAREVVMRRIALILALLAGAVAGRDPETVVVRPQEIDDVLVNPGIGFMTFQRFNGDPLNTGLTWTEGYPIEYRESKKTGPVENFPMTSIAYWRIYWRFLEPEKGKYRWDMIDKALDTAHAHGQSLMLRVAPYGTGEDNDVPDWYRATVGPEPAKKRRIRKWRTDPENPLYAASFGRFIRALGARYDGHPDLESVDLSIVGAWGEGAGSKLLSPATRKAHVDSYVESFRKTPLLMLLTDPKTNSYGLSKRDVGWRVDCLGDMGGVRTQLVPHVGLLSPGDHQVRHERCMEKSAGQF